MSDLDLLFEDLNRIEHSYDYNIHSPTKPPPPTTTTNQKANPPPNPDITLQSLMDDLDDKDVPLFPSLPQQPPPPSSDKSQLHQQQQKELDSLLNDIGDVIMSQNSGPSGNSKDKTQQQTKLTRKSRVSGARPNQRVSTRERARDNAVTTNIQETVQYLKGTPNHKLEPVSNIKADELQNLLDDLEEDLTKPIILDVPVRLPSVKNITSPAKESNATQPQKKNKADELSDLIDELSDITEALAGNASAKNTENEGYKVGFPEMNKSKDKTKPPEINKSSEKLIKSPELTKKKTPEVTKKYPEMTKKYPEMSKKTPIPDMIKNIPPKPTSTAETGGPATENLALLKKQILPKASVDISPKPPPPVTTKATPPSPATTAQPKPTPKPFVKEEIIESELADLEALISGRSSKPPSSPSLKNNNNMGGIKPPTKTSPNTSNPTLISPKKNAAPSNLTPTEVDLMSLMDSLIDNPGPEPLNDITDNSDEVAELLRDLSKGSKVHVPPSQSSNMPVRSNLPETESEPGIDDLIEQLNNPNAPQPTLPIPTTKNESHLNALMTDLNMVNVPKSSGELEALYSNLENQSHHSSKPKTLTKPNDSNDLENLLNELRPGEKPQAKKLNEIPAPQTPQKDPRPNRNPPVASAKTADLEAMMETLNNPVLFQDTEIHNPSIPKRQEKLPKGVCAGCRKWIGGSQKITAMGKEYHVDHFQCSSCNCIIGTGNFYEREGQPQCETCNANLFAPTCAKCGFTVVNQVVNAMSQYWHIDCFVCQRCTSPFLDGAFYDKDGLPYCRVCFNIESQLSTCRGCHQAIRGRSILALGSYWHPEHFTCQYCNFSFPDNVFFEFGGLPYCRIHYETLLRGR